MASLRIFRASLSFLASALVLLLLVFFETGCANIVPPGGGPRDSLPPILIRATPPDSSLNVKTTGIQLEFNEFIEAKNTAEQVFISPLPQKQPLIEYKLRNLSVKLKDSLLPNTTYIIDFGRSIVDINEGNKMNGLRYVFSTGSRLDTNSISGNVVMAENGSADSTLLVLLHTSAADSAVVKEKPRYITRVDVNGNFTFNYLPEGIFYLYALKDADGDKRYNPATEAFAFANDPVILPSTNAPQQLLAYTAAKVNESRADAAIPVTGGPPTLLYTTNLENGFLGLTDSLQLRYRLPLQKIDSSRIQLTIDSFETIKNVSFTYDSVRKSLLIHTSWKEGARYRLLLNSDYAQDTSGKKPGKTDTLSFTMKRVADYGTVRIRFQSLDTSRHPVLLFYENNALVERVPLQRAEWFSPLFKPGKYDLFLLYDSNKNGLWDPGDFFSKPKRQPERVVPLKVSLTVKANWDNELKIDLQQ